MENGDAVGHAYGVLSALRTSMMAEGEFKISILVILVNAAILTTSTKWLALGLEKCA